ncbi:HYR domain-containing protein [Peribacillus sp. NPDC094092]|uniref:HYR domain-containing protein n=1 Tax=Peribacillus sp. NPDC094092 TaxID=3390611 RepID=UPI003D002865
MGPGGVGSSFNTGINQVNQSAVRSGNGIVEITFTPDTQPPTIICSGNITQYNDPGVCGAIVNYPPSTVNDSCPGATSVCSLPSGLFFPVGATTVTCRATDAAGNISAHCSFTVTV